MGIVKNEGAIDCWCDGCGALVRIASADWFDGLEAIRERGWFAVATDYGCPDGPAWEHFCSTDCLDPPEWNA
jgi:hypothetical protein